MERSAVVLVPPIEYLISEAATLFYLHVIKNVIRMKLVWHGRQLLGTGALGAKCLSTQRMVTGRWLSQRRAHSTKTNWNARHRIVRGMESFVRTPDVSTLRARCLALNLALHILLTATTPTSSSSVATTSSAAWREMSAPH